MEKHREKLNDVCRLWKKTIKLSDRYCTKKYKSDYKDEIMKILWYNIEDDNLHIQVSLMQIVEKDLTYIKKHHQSCYSHKTCSIWEA